MAIRIGINGLGRIGRGFLRLALGRDDLRVVAVNDLADPPLLAHLLRHDSLYGPLGRQVSADKDALVAGAERIRWTGLRRPEEIPWKDAGVDLVIEATGAFTSRADAAGHLRGGARRVVISSPSADADLTVCFGVNDGAYDPARHVVISNASCTTNAMAVVLSVAAKAFGIERAAMTTVHCATNNQVLMDAPHRDPRRARAALLSMIPTSTSAAGAILQVMPELRGRLHALAVRVPTSAVSLVDLTLLLARKASLEAVREAFTSAADGDLSGVLGYTDEPLVSIDFLGDPRSAVVDGSLLAVEGDGWVKVLAWYDNERGYVQRLADLVRLMALREAAGRRT
ncbi:MAG TPA: type I glyceraldehyde-3-phosphate dehydrogenase [Candidatus Cryosericum sp.]|nr:type I glyceraldehyde-3-phosphate dehydrogenase [Candidatus Cryosericum sp.]